MPRIGFPKPGENAVCEECELIYSLDDDGQPKTIEPFTCDDCGGAVEVAK